jgi:ketosteroid isomerase-like protein
MRAALRWGSFVAVTCALALVAAGCGESDQEQARDAVQDYVDAVGAQDYDAVCDLYSDSFKDELAVGENCAAFVQEQTSGGPPQELEVVDVRVNGDKATADLDASNEAGGPSRITLQLERDGDDWRISGF